MGLIRDFYGSTVGKKIAMAVSGLALVLFVVGHMAGNLKIFAGIDSSTGDYKIDDYGVFLRTMGAEMFGKEGVLWIVRLGLLAAVVIHAFSGIALARLNRRAKPQGYQVRSYRSANAASLTMLYGGLFLIASIFFTSRPAPCTLVVLCTVRCTRTCTARFRISLLRDSTLWRWPFLVFICTTERGVCFRPSVWTRLGGIRGFARRLRLSPWLCSSASPPCLSVSLSEPYRLRLRHARQLVISLLCGANVCN